MALLLKLAFLNRMSLSHWCLKQHAPTTATHKLFFMQGLKLPERPLADVNSIAYRFKNSENK